jgi:hypothetical protein
LTPRYRHQCLQRLGASRAGFWWKHSQRSYREIVGCMFLRSICQGCSRHMLRLPVECHREPQCTASSRSQHRLNKDFSDASRVLMSLLNDLELPRHSKRVPKLAKCMNEEVNCSGNLHTAGESDLSQEVRSLASSVVMASGETSSRKPENIGLNSGAVVGRCADRDMRLTPGVMKSTCF